MQWLYDAHAQIVHTDIVLNTLCSVDHPCVFDKAFHMRSMMRVSELFPHLEEHGAEVEDDVDDAAHEDQAIDVNQVDMLDVLFDPARVDALDTAQVAAQGELFGAHDDAVALDDDDKSTCYCWLIKMLVKAQNASVKWDAK